MRVPLSLGQPANSVIQREPLEFASEAFAAALCADGWLPK